MTHIKLTLKLRVKNSLKFFSFFISLIHFKMGCVAANFSVRFTANSKGQYCKNEKISRVSSCLAFIVENWIDVYEGAGRIGI